MGPWIEHPFQTKAPVVEQVDEIPVMIQIQSVEISPRPLHHQWAVSIHFSDRASLEGNPPFFCAFESQS